MSANSGVGPGKDSLTFGKPGGTTTTPSCGGWRSPFSCGNVLGFVRIESVLSNVRTEYIRSCLHRMNERGGWLVGYLLLLLLLMLR